MSWRHQDPATGMFAYMVPLMSGSARKFSRPFDDLLVLCRLGDGEPRQARRLDLVASGDTLLVNLYIPSTARGRSRGRPSGWRPPIRSASGSRSW
jgi:hypothetical protein